MPINLKQFLAKQLNDHNDSPSGVDQPTYYEWTESHISDALVLGLSYLYSLLPNEFSKPAVYQTTSEDCIINFCDFCPKFMGVVSLWIDDNRCVEVTKVDGQVNSLMNLLDVSCGSDPENAENNFAWDIVDGSSCVVKFDRPLPVGTRIRYMCANPPDGVDVLEGDSLYQYHPMIADYALWWLYRTDSESRSNLDRAKLHFEALRDFVTTKLLLEFSLQEDDYKFGRRLVDDN